MSAFEKLRWTNSMPPTKVNEFLQSDKANEFLASIGDSLTNLFSLTGTVDFDAGTTPRQKALQLLQAAAEVEHQFIAQYLYAYYCSGNAPINKSELMTIAQEEMGHLITVQNLLTMLNLPDAQDKPPYLERLRTITSDEEPSPFKLEPLTREFIARFLFAESSTDADIPHDIGQHLPSGLMLQDLHRVGALYAQIYFLFQETDAEEGPWAIPSPELLTLGHLSDDDLTEPNSVLVSLSALTNWGGTTNLDHPNKNILVMPDLTFTSKAEMRQAALTIIHTIAGQGEGLTDQTSPSPEKSHAQRLRAMYDILSAPGTPPLDTGKFPTDPYTKANTADPASETNLIDAVDAGNPAKDATKAANAFDRTYEKLLLQIALSVAAGVPEDRTGAINAALDLMISINQDAKTLISLPRKNGAPVPPDLLAAPPFTFPRDGIPNKASDIQTRLSAISG